MLPSDRSVIGNRRWIVVRSPDGTEWRIVTAYPFNPRSLPNFNYLNPLSPLLPIVLDALLCLFGLLPWRAVAVYDDGGEPGGRQGECHYLNRRVAQSDVPAEVERLTATALSGGWNSRSDTPGQWSYATKARLREAFVCLIICLAASVYGLTGMPNSRLPLVNLLAALWVMVDIAWAIGHEVSVRIPRPPAHMVLVPALMSALMSVLIFLLLLPNPATG